MIAAAVVDIEGTTSPTSTLRERLYGYTRQHLVRWLTDNRCGAAASVIAGTQRLAGRPNADAAEVVEILCSWLDADVKTEPLKTAQGLICAEVPPRCPPRGVLRRRPTRVGRLACYRDRTLCVLLGFNT
jgi:enolase-phosphatase E1